MSAHTTRRLVIPGLILLALLATTAHAQQIIYVNGTTGNNTWSGLCEVWDGGVCGPKQTIQAGITTAIPGDTVLVADGVYTGYGNKNLDFYGQPITVRSANGPETCIIDCGEDGRGVYFHHWETPAAVLDGFTIRNGDLPGGCTWGGGILCVDDANPTITNCIITANGACDGGGVGCYHASPTFTNCTTADNKAYNGGGGIQCCSGFPTFVNCAITSNTAVSYAGGVYCTWSHLTISNCTIAGNEAGHVGGGIACQAGFASFTNCTISQNSAPIGGGSYFFGAHAPAPSTDFRNCVLWGDSAYLGPEIYLDFGWTPFPQPFRLWVSFCDVQGGEEGVYVVEGSELIWGDGNIDIDPLFVDPERNDFHLLASSTCIDTGDPDFVLEPGHKKDIDGETRVWRGIGGRDGQARVDMGVDEYGSYVYGDLNCDRRIDVFDIDPFILAVWDPAAYAVAYPECSRELLDCNGDGYVNDSDIDVFVELLTRG